MCVCVVCVYIQRETERDRERETEREKDKQPSPQFNVRVFTSLPQNISLILWRSCLLTTPNQGNYSSILSFSLSLFFFFFCLFQAFYVKRMKQYVVLFLLLSLNIFLWFIHTIPYISVVHYFLMFNSIPFCIHILCFVLLTCLWTLELLPFWGY